MVTLENVYVHGFMGLIFDSNLQLIDLPVNYHYHRAHSRAARRDKSVDIINNIHKYAPSSTSVPDELCYMVDAWGGYPYGHLYDTLQYVHDYEKNNVVNNKWLVSYRKKYQTNNIIENHWNTFGCTSMLPISKEKIIHAEKIHVSEHNTYPAQIDVAKLDWIQQKYFTRYREQIKQKTDELGEQYGDIKLYLHRTGKRPVVNYNEIQPILEQNNFITLTGREDIVDHMAMFNNASVVIGPHGSLFRNSIFSSPHKQHHYYEYCPDSRVDKSIQSFSKSCGVQHYTHTVVPGLPGHCIEIPVDHLLQVLDSHR